MAITRACQYLTNNLANLDRKASLQNSESALELALVARALQMNQDFKTGAETAFEILAKIRQEKEGFMFWGSGDSTSFQVVFLANIRKHYSIIHYYFRPLVLH